MKPRGGALKRTTELKRGSPLRRTEFKRARPDEGAPPRKRARDTGPGRRTRDLVLARDNWQCVACGKTVGGAFTWWSIQHRLARGQVGGNDLSNLIVLCGSATSQGCHRTAENRDEDYRLRGYWIRSGKDVDPATTPLLLVRDTGPRWVLARDDGTYEDTEPPQEWQAA